MKITGTIKVLSFKEERVAIKLGDAQLLSKEGNWEEQYGDVWISSFDGSVFEACKMLEKGAGIQSVVESNTAKSGKEYLNIVNIGLKVKETDVNEDLYETLPEDAPFPKKETPPGEEIPSSEQRPEDSPEAEVEKVVDNIPPKPKSIAVDDEKTLIIRQTCIKAAGFAVNLTSLKDVEEVNAFVAEFVAIAKRLEKYVLEGK